MPSASSPTKSLAISVQVILLLSGFAALFFLLTNAVPLVQLGWMKDFGKKSRYVRPMLISVSVFCLLLAVVRWKWPRIFELLWWNKLWQRFWQMPLGAIVAFLFVVYAAMMTVVGFERHLALETRAFDLGIFAQAVWNTLHGDFLFSSIKENINLLGDHISPILLLVVPFYALWSDPRMLVLLQAVAAASSMIPLALIARDKLKDKPLVVIFLLMFFFFQPMRAALHEDFHPEVLAEPFLWWAFLFLERKKILRFLLCLVIAATGKENFLGIAFFLGFYAFVFRNMRWLGIGVMAASAGLFVWETQWLIPHLTGAKYFYGGNYSIAWSDPVNGILKKLIVPESLEYVFKIFLPFLFLPAAHLPTLLLTFPVLFQNLLSVNGCMRSFNYHYLTGLTPFLFISTIYALARLSEKHTWVRRRIHWIGFALLAAAILRSGPSEYYFFSDIHSHRSAHRDMVRYHLGRIPRDARVLTHNSFIPQLCNRKFVYQFNYNQVPTKIDQARQYQADVLAWDAQFWEPNSPPLDITMRDALAAGYAIEFEQEGFYILKRQAGPGE